MIRYSKRSNSRFGSIFNKIIPSPKRSQSQIIATVLLIMIVIASAVILMNFAVPFVKKQLAGSGCFDAIRSVSISDNKKYTCYDTSTKEMRVQAHIGDSNENINGFLIELGGAASKSIKITNDSLYENVRMYDSTYNKKLELPGKNEDRTYVIKSEAVESVKIYPILKEGSSCGVSDSLEKVDVCR